MEKRRAAEVFPPGEFLREELEARGWTQVDLAEILGRPVHTINEIILGKRGISPETAKGLAAALGTSAELWMNLEAAYQLRRVGGDDEESVRRRARIYSLGPIKEMTRRGWLEEAKSVDELEKGVLEFFGMKSLEDEPAFVAHAARKGSAGHTSAQRAWLFRARQLCRAIDAEPYTEEKLERALAQLRLLLPTPQEAGRVPRVLSEAGVRFLVVEALAGTRIDGACFWVDDSPVVALSMRYDRIDNFWFVLMHELGHVKNGDGVVVDTDLEKAQSDTGRSESERGADRFAAESLVSQQQLRKFMSRVRPRYSASKIERFAEEVNVHPGIVVGQLQHREQVAWSAFRSKLVPMRKWVTEAALTDGWGMIPSARVGGPR